MEALYQTVFIVHAMVATLGLIIFYIPVFSRKGGNRHKNVGRYYVNAMRVTAYSGLLMSACLWLDPLGIKLPPPGLTTQQLALRIQDIQEAAYFFSMLGLLILVSVNQAVAVLRVKQENWRLRNARHLMLPCVVLIYSTVMLVRGTMLLAPISIAFSLLCLMVSSRAIYYSFNTNLQPREWVGDHMGGMLGSGLGAHIAFMLNGGQRLFSEYMVGNMLALWILPLLIGSVLIFYSIKRQGVKSEGNKLLIAKT